MNETGLILLAAGSSSRMGEAKQLLPYQGGPLILHALRQTLASRSRPVIVVLGARAAEIGPTLAGQPVTVVLNPRWEEGMGTSIQAGLEALEATGVSGAILALADQPLITASIYNRLIDIHERTGAPIVASEYAGTVGVPVFFARSHWGPLQDLNPGQGCKGVILSYRDRAVRVPCPEAEVDLDTPADVERLTATIPS